MLTVMQPAEIVRSLRTEAGLSVRALAQAAGVASSTISRIEQGRLHPTVYLLQRVAEAAGARLRIEPDVDYAVSAVGLALSMRPDLEQGDETWPVRKAAEFAARFRSSDERGRHRMVAAEPPSTGNRRWDVFLAALVEWLTVQLRVPTPDWVHHPDRYLGEGWWVTRMKSMHAWEYAGAPASFKIRGVYIHRDSLTNV